MPLLILVSFTLLAHLFLFRPRLFLLVPIYHCFIPVCSCLPLSFITSSPYVPACLCLSLPRYRLSMLAHVSPCSVPVILTCPRLFLLRLRVSLLAPICPRLSLFILASSRFFRACLCLTFICVCLYLHLPILASSPFFPICPRLSLLRPRYPCLSPFVLLFRPRFSLFSWLRPRLSLLVAICPCFVPFVLACPFLSLLRSCLHLSVLTSSRLFLLVWRCFVPVYPCYNIASRIKDSGVTLLFYGNEYTKVRKIPNTEHRS